MKNDTKERENYSAMQEENDLASRTEMQQNDRSQQAAVTVGYKPEYITLMREEKICHMQRITESLIKIFSIRRKPESNLYGNNFYIIQIMVQNTEQKFRKNGM